MKRIPRVLRQKVEKITDLNTYIENSEIREDTPDDDKIGPGKDKVESSVVTVNPEQQCQPTASAQEPYGDTKQGGWIRWWRIFRKFLSFVGPGMMVSIAYMDPGNYSTDVQGGALKQYKLLFVILLSTVIALYLQSLSIKLGTVTGKDLARNCHDHMPRWVGYFVYVLAEAAILATDVAEVAGTAIALDILLHIPLIAGVFITIVDVLLVLLAWGPAKGMMAIHLLEYFIMVLLFAVLVCFCVLLAKIPPANVGWVLKGYLPSNALTTGGGIQAAAGILGATVMPHSLYLGSATVLPRVLQHDEDHGYKKDSNDETKMHYRPSGQAIDSTIMYSIVELIVALTTVAIFVNSAILIVAGDTMYGSERAENADLYELYDMLKEYLSKAAAVLFMVALLLSGQSAGVICTLAGQIVSEGHINWHVKPWLRRLITRGIAMIPCIAVVGALGKSGISSALNWSQVVLTITLPFLASPLVWLTSRPHIMTVQVKEYDQCDGPIEYEGGRSFCNHWITATIGAILCLFIGVVNVYLLVDIGIEGSP